MAKESGNRTPDRNVDALVEAWRTFLRGIVWQELIKGVKPKPSGCGPIYDLPNPINRPYESFAIADMRNLSFTVPHYHTNGEIEVYFGLQGSGTVITGGVPQSFGVGNVVVTPPETGHFVIPDTDLIMAVINTPPFDPNNSVDLTDSNPGVSFDRAQFDTLTAHLS